jgi:hypothetical protein
MKKQHPGAAFFMAANFIQSSKMLLFRLGTLLI